MDFFKHINWTDIGRHIKGDDLDTESAIRAYPYSPGMMCLQVRGPEKLAGNRPGKHGVIASAKLDRDTAIELRDALNEIIDGHLSIGVKS